MRRYLYLGVAALVALSFSACQKAEDDPAIDDSGLMTVTLTADRANGETRAAAVEGTDGVTYIWTDTDLENFKLFSVTKEEVTSGETTTTREVLTEIENPTLSLSSDNNILSVTAKVAPGATLRAIVSSEWTGQEGDDNRKPRLPMIQSSLEGNMDPASDILVAEDVTVDESSEKKLSFHRPVTVNKMTLKGLNSAEKVEKIVISSDKHLTGYYKYDTGKMVGQHTELTVKYVSGTVKADELYPVYFVTMPNEDQTLTVTVETVIDSKVFRYTKEFARTINFTLGKFSTFNVDLAGLGEAVEQIDYSGEWVIAGTHDGHSIAATKYSSGKYYPASEVAINDDVVTVLGSKDPYKMTVTLLTTGDYEGRYTIMDAGGKYLTASGGLNGSSLQGMNDPNANSYWIITKNGDGTFDIVADYLEDLAYKSMRVNWNNGNNPRVTCYKMSSGQPKVVLYPYEKVVEEVVSSPVTFSQPSVAGCSIAVSVDGNPITSGTKVAQGKTVTLAATAGTGCTFAGWTVTGATVADAAASTTTFKMGESAVAVSATFTTAGRSVWEDDFSKCKSSGTALSSLSGAVSGFTGNYSNLGSVYPMDGAIRIGKASSVGRISTPVLSSVSGNSANLTITFKAAGWNGKTVKLTVSASKGTVTEGQTTIASEASMSGSTPSMTGTVYTFHVTGADKTTKITFDTTNSMGLDDLVIKQTN